MDFELKAECAFIANLTALNFWRRFELPLLRRVDDCLPSQFVRCLLDLSLWDFAIFVDYDIDNYSAGNVLFQGFIWIGGLNCFDDLLLSKPSFTNRSSEWTRLLGNRHGTKTKDGSKHNGRRRY